MSTRKTTFFLLPADRRRLAGRRDGHRVATRSHAGFVGADHRGPADEQRAGDRRDRRADVPQHREGGDADGRQHQDGDEGQGAGPHRLLSTGAAAGGSPDDLFHRFFGGPGGGGGADQDEQGGRGNGQRPPASARTDGARGRHRFHHQQGRLHPHEQSRGRGRDQDRGHAVRRRSRPELHRQGHRPRSAHRQRADSARGQAESPSAGSQVRRFVAGGRRATG